MWWLRTSRSPAHVDRPSDSINAGLREHRPVLMATPIRRFCPSRRDARGEDERPESSPGRGAAVESRAHAARRKDEGPGSQPGPSGDRRQTDVRPVSHAPDRRDKFPARSPGDSCKTASGWPAAGSASGSSSSAAGVTGARRTAATCAGTRPIDERSGLPVSVTSAPPRGGPITRITSAPTSPGCASA